MVDIHSHLIFGVDDGACSYDESLKMLEQARKQGIRTIFATPHFHKNVFESEKAGEYFQELLWRASDINIDIRLGYEVFLNSAEDNVLLNKSRLTLGKSGYMLVELPLYAGKEAACNIIHNLKLEGITPIIAHPEREIRLLNNFYSFLSLVKAGCLIQVDTASILGVYGWRIKEFARWIIQKDMADIIASNAHCPQDYSERYIKAYNKVVKWTNPECAEKLFKINPGKVVNKKINNIYNAI
ncbi:MAG: tyrosine-protein phosphatase [Acetivibrionales bacterium]|jgi:protein-tyrosine phosphatase